MLMFWSNILLGQILYHQSFSFPFHISADKTTKDEHALLSCQIVGQCLTLQDLNSVSRLNLAHPSASDAQHPREPLPGEF